MEHYETRDGRPDLTNLEMDLFDVRMKHSTEQLAENPKPSRWHNILKPACLPITIIIIFIGMVIMFSLLNDDYTEDLANAKEQRLLCALQDCQVSLVESIPEGMTYGNGTVVPLLSTYDAWMSLLQSTGVAVHVAAFYWSLRAKDMVTDDSDTQGKDVYNTLEMIGRERWVRIVQNAGDATRLQESALLQRQGLADVRTVNHSALLGGGVMHTKLLVVDGAHFYLGSANMDWRALTQVKELGLVAYNCSCLAMDLNKIFEVYWLLGAPDAVVPKAYPSKFTTFFNKSNPAKLRLNGVPSEVYFTSSPAQFCSRNRESDISALLDVINSAQRFVHVAVMDYMPMLYYTKPRRFWPVIDDALRAAVADRGVSVKLLVSNWNHTKPMMFGLLHSLAIFGATVAPGKMQIKVFTVPSYTERQAKIPFSRVNHNKYMVTESQAYIGTSNWIGDYFTQTAGVAIVIRQTDEWVSANRSINSVLFQLQTVFDRDWNSDYATDLTKLL